MAPAVAPGVIVDALNSRIEIRSVPQIFQHVNVTPVVAGEADVSHEGMRSPSEQLPIAFVCAGGKYSPRLHVGKGRPDPWRQSSPRWQFTSKMRSPPVQGRVVVVVWGFK